MMSNYFAQKMDEYQDMIERYREKWERPEILSPYMMSKKFYNILEAEAEVIYNLYQRYSSGNRKRMGNYDHIMYHDVIKDGLCQYKIQFIHLICKPYQCWMNLF